MRNGLIVILALLVSGCAGQRHSGFIATHGDLAVVRQVAVGRGDTKPPRAVNPYEASRWRRLHWLDENGLIPDGALRRAIQQRQANLAQALQRGEHPTAGIDPTLWIERGPENVGGRTRSLVVDPTNPNRLWIGAVSGGLWHSEDAGTSWQVVDDWLPSLAICCLAIDPNNADVMYAGTGEGFFNGDAIGGAGIYKSTDAGETWDQLANTADWDNVNRIAISPDDSNIILASRRYGGIYRSSTAGVSWHSILWAQGSFYVAFDPTDGTKAVAHLIDYDWDNDDWFHRAIYSADAGSNWTTAGGLDYQAGFSSRIELAYAAGDTNIVYASCAADGGTIWRSTDGGQNYTPRTEAGYTSSANWYANPLWVDPTNSDFLVTGGTHYYKSTDGGVTLTKISDGYIMTEQPHPDTHLVVQDAGFDGVFNKRVYVCTDGGVWATDDIYTASTSSGWEKLDANYRTSQFYGAAGDGVSGLIIGGTQDNGTLRLQPDSDLAHLTFGGDGGFCAIDPTDPSFCYGEYITLQLFRSTNGGDSGNWVYDGIADAGNSANFIAPFILDPNDPNTMLAGGRSLWRSNNIKQTTGGAPDWAAIREPGNDNISAIAAAKGNSDEIWVGLNNGEVHRTSNGTAGSPDWTAMDDNESANPFPNRYVTRIVIDPIDHDIAYVCLGGFSADNLWMTADGGESWTDITGSGSTGLPDAPIRGMARHPVRPDWLYVGTEVGIFATTDNGLTWSTTNDGPANVSVDELVFMHKSSTLLAATHGRGIYTVDIPGSALLDYDLDGDTDLDDFARFTDCLSGPDAAPSPPWPMTATTCLATFDADTDGDIDQPDFAAFQSGFTGPF